MADWREHSEIRLVEAYNVGAGNTEVNDAPFPSILESLQS
jgi:hypothetical protein